MSLALALQNINPSRRRIKRTYKVTLSVNYVTGGDTVNFLTATNPNHLETPLPSARLLTGYVVDNFPAGFKAELIPGTTNANWKLKIWDNAAGTELAQAGYPAGLTGATDIRISADNPIGV